MQLFSSIRWKNLRGRRKILQRKVGNVWKGKVKTDKWEVRKKMTPSNKDCEWSVQKQWCFAAVCEHNWIILAKVFSIPSWAPCQATTYWQFCRGLTRTVAQPHQCHVLHTCWGTPTGPRTKSIICHWQFKEPHGAILTPSWECAGCLCGLSTWKVSQGLIAGALCLQPPHEPGAHTRLLRCQLDCSELFSTCHQSQLAQSWSWSIPGHDHPCFEVMMLFIIDFSQLGVKPHSDLRLIKGIFFLPFFSFALQLVFIFLWVLKICNKKDLLVFNTLKIRALLFPGSNFWTSSAWQSQ